MTPPERQLRRAGTSTSGGTVLTWSVAEGARGRRWRGLTTESGRLRMALLLELDLDSRPARLELSTRDGLLTLHPRADGTSLLGNVVTPSGVRHLALPWGLEDELVCTGDPITIGAVAHRLGGSIAPGETTDAPVVLIDSSLEVQHGTGRFSRVSTDTWRFEAWLSPVVSSSEVGADAGIRVDTRVEVDDEGCPVGIADDAVWPLELT